MTTRHTLRRNRAALTILTALIATALLLLGTGLATWSINLH